MDWTEQQKEAITRRDSGLIVSAAAGSGKHRCWWNVCCGF